MHNTYGERHAYLLRLDDAGRAQADKEFYVSPFFAVSGRYLMRFSAPGPRLQITMALPAGRRDAVHRAGSAAPPVRPPPAPCCGATLRFPLMSLRVSALIRLQGVKLWLRRLPVVPRPPHASRSPS